MRLDGQVVVSRPPCLNIPGATYHVMARGHLKELIFLDSTDCYRFVVILSHLVVEFEIELHIECRMGNHFHMVITTPRGNLSDFMQQVDGQYGQYFNRRHKRVGHVFQGPFRRVLVEHDAHLLVAISYVLKNPVVAGLVDRPEDWKWCSYRAMAGLTAAPSYLSLEWIRRLFPAASLEESQERLQDFVARGCPLESYFEEDAVAFGSDNFKRLVRSYVTAQLSMSSLPRIYRALGRPTLAQLFEPPMSAEDRARTMQRAFVVYGYRQSEIARALCLHPASVSRIICSLRNRN